jgi:peptidoglycan/xylan/chitin deacetylase (PgdA/CDA1 family)
MGSCGHGGLVWDTFSLPAKLNRTIAPSRKILCTATLVGACLAGACGAPSSVAATPALVQARFSQAGRRLIFSLRTARPVALAKLNRQPTGEASAYLCVSLRSEREQPGERRLCLGGTHRGSSRAGLQVLGPEGEVADKETIAVHLERPEPDKLVASLLPARAGLAPQPYRWRVVASGGGCGRRSQGSCSSSLPPRGTRVFRLRPVRAVGCTAGSGGLVTNGPRDRKVVALTFDDGPSEYTPGFLRVLREKQVPATFFEIGEEMSRYPAAMRQIVSEGDEIGNHTMHHTEFPSFGEIAPATDLAESITHFRPCLFRPPGGAVNSSVIAAAAADDLRTVTWDVDPADWSMPGRSAVYSRVVDAAQAGSIILMHDGGGDRSGTLAALPSIIDTLRDRGYGFATVTGLLGQRMIFRPYG